MRNDSGFTLIELLVVIVIIAILAVIGVVSYRGIQVRAQATVIADGLTKLDNSFQLWALDEGFTRWIPEENSTGGMSIEERIDDDTPPWASLNQYLAQPPRLQDIGTQPWQYDNDETSESYAICSANGGIGWCTGDDKATCSSEESQKLAGVNILIRYLRPDQKELAQRINSIVDGNDEGDDWEDCGKIRWYDSTSQPANRRGMIIYSISYTKQIQ